MTVDTITITELSALRKFRHSHIGDSFVFSDGFMYIRVNGTPHKLVNDATCEPIEIGTLKQVEQLLKNTNTKTFNFSWEA